ncbi:MAG: hypothetical protein K0S93_50 [Nitrososphaeraceae archaeon]|jgi:hypothetical protein|nr:hypothetical protein [Nitrososphaeraceae archaeon]
MKNTTKKLICPMCDENKIAVKHTSYDSRSFTIDYDGNQIEEISDYSYRHAEEDINTTYYCIECEYEADELEEFQ